MKARRGASTPRSSILRELQQIDVCHFGAPAGGRAHLVHSSSGTSYLDITRYDVQIGGEKRVVQFARGPVCASPIRCAK
jgi:hypothetical protein